MKINEILDFFKTNLLPKSKFRVGSIIKVEVNDAIFGNLYYVDRIVKITPTGIYTVMLGNDEKADYERKDEEQFFFPFSEPEIKRISIIRL